MYKRQDADFSNAILTNTVFGDAILDESNFQGADLSGANLFDVNGLRQEQLDQACGNEKTVLPEGLSIRTCTTERPAQLMADQQPTGAPQDSYMPAPPAPIARRTIPYYLQSEPHKVAPTQTVTDYETAMSLLKQELRSKPIDSPSRARLERAISLIEKSRTQGK